jgi:hypothetical protein
MDAYLERREGAQRPADIYRTFGPALRYATHTLGSFAARKMMQELSLQTTMPFSELDNPDWIDPYTGRGEKKYEQVRVRKVELSSDGNSDEMPVILADLLETLEEGGVTTYGFKNGQLVKEQMEPMDKKTEPPRWLESWWDEFDNAQRGGFNAEADEGDEHVEPEFDVIDKDFEGKSEFEFTEALDGLRALYAKELAEMRNIVREYSDGLTILRRNPEIVAHATKWVQSLIRHSPPFVRFLKFMRAIAHEQEPQDLLALILPFQTETGYTLEDLSTIKIPGQCRDLDEYYRMYQDQILDQFQDEPGRMGSEPTGDELDEFVSEEIHERVRVYLSPLGNLKYHQAYRDFKPEKNYKTAREFQAARLDAAWAAFWEAQKRSMVGQRYLPHAKVAWKEVYASTKNETYAWKAFWSECATQRDARYTPEFVEAEIMAAVMGDGSQGSAFKAGWDAWRSKIDPEANRAYHAAMREGKKSGEAMQVFWREVEARKNVIASITKDGVKLANGRVIDWGITRLKITKGEIKLTLQEKERLLAALVSKNWGLQIRTLLQQLIQKELTTTQQP